MTWAVIPAKGLARSKSRLATALRPDARERLAEEMLTAVLAAAAGSAGITQIAVITDCERAAACAKAFGALVEQDPNPKTRSAAGRQERAAPGRGTGAGLGRVVDHGLARIALRGAARALVLMGDLPLIVPADVDAAIARMATGRVVLAPDRWGRGTNALGLSLSPHPQTCFGHDDSLQRHQRAFAQAGLATTILTRPGIAFDVDTVEDLARYGGPDAQLCSRSDGPDTHP